MTTGASEKIPLLCPADEAPLRASAVASEDWGQQGVADSRMLQAQHVRRGHASLRRRLDENAVVLRAAYQTLAAAAAERHAITPGAEWILDNAHVIEDQLAATREALPRHRRLSQPLLAEGDVAGSLRVLALASHFIAHSDCVISLEALTLYLRGAQTVAPLELAELWTLPTVLRLALLENLRRLARRIVWSQRGRQLADQFADLLLPATQEHALEPPDMRDWSPSMRTGFAVQLMQRLQFHEGQFPLTLQRLGERLAVLGQSISSITAEEHRAQRAANLSIRNLITSMRLIGDTDWRQMVENLSLPHQVLARDAIYRRCDLGTRELCRHEVAELSRWSGSSEQAVAERVLEEPDDASSTLLGNARGRLECRLRARVPPRERWRRGLRRAGMLWYAPAVLVLTTAATLLLLRWPVIALPQPAARFWMGLALWWPVSEAVTALINAISVRWLPPRPLPRLELQAVPDVARTLVVIPCLLSSRSVLDELLRQLEAHYLNNVDPNLHFALLSDWIDADAALRPADTELLEAARAGIAQLNHRHGCATPQFLLLHRERRWNDAEQCWMGWERKRGKLHELNRLLRGAADTSFAAASDAPPRTVRYVVTLDADTRMQMDTVSALLSIALHPLQRPRHDARGRVIAGYGMLQPRVTPTLPRRAERSLFEHLYASAAGMDPYAGAVSDVYQDLFGSGIYVGKGLYDIDAFETALAGRVPDNTVLSHDLLEGSYARCALVADVEFFDEFPAHAEVAAERQHRWTRGDWQLLPWLLGPRGHGLPVLARWQMLDNLRRTLIAPALLAAMVLLWCLKPAAGLWIPLLALLLLAAPVLAGSLLHRLRVLHDAAALAVAGFALLAHSAWLMMDAIGRSLWRMAVSKRSRLEWISAAQSGHGKGETLGHFSWPLRSATIVVIAVTAIVVLLGGQSLSAVTPTLLLWWLAPVVARELSRRRPAALAAPLSKVDTAELRRIGRRTWRYFTQFVTDTDHHLPPDNFQEDPTPRVAHRTSPTNIGLYLLSCVAARDLGWLSAREFALRVTATLDTLDRLERCEGHFLNWYDTQTLAPLAPRYVSTVDSGNLAGYLIVLACACDTPGATPATRAEALRDTLAILGEELARRAPALRAEMQPLLDAATAADSSAAAGMTLLHETTAQLVSRLRAEARGNPQLHPDPADWAEEVEYAVARCAAIHDASDDAVLARIALRARTLARAMNFRMLFDAGRELFSIGWRVEDGTLDRSHYDLLASEARLASFLAIAWHQVPASHWRRLGRGLADTSSGPALESWSGSMFEYLMPSVVMATPRDSLLEVSARRAVTTHIEYGRQHRLPWGVSEAAYAARDREHTYQYHAFGVPQLGLKTGLQADLVVAPYATALAALCAPQAALANFARLRAQGVLGSFGFYESIDYTPERQRDDQPVLVRAFMAHHQGMSIAAIANVVQAQRLRRLFHTDPHVYAAELLLQEMFPRSIRVRTLRAAEPPLDRIRIGEALTRRFATPHLDRPALQLLSNGEFAVALTTAGGGFSRWRQLALTRWREDATLDDWGSFIYIVDLDSGRIWSATYQPVATEPDRYEVLFQEDRVRFTREDDGIFCELEVVVAPDDPVELRRLRLRNRSSRSRRLAIYSYMEPVLASEDADLAHPAFSNLFVETDYLPDCQTLLAMRRPRDAADPRYCLGHSVVSAQWHAPLQFETSRAAFIGRGRTRRRPRALEAAALSNSLGAVLDPALALRVEIELDIDAEHDLNFTTFAADSREAAEELAQRYGRHTDFERSSQLAWTHARIQLTHLGVDLLEAQAFQRLATRIVFSQPSFRPGPRILAALSRPASALWRFGISGDLPIVVWRFTQAEQRPQLLQAFRAHAYWRSKRLAVDLVILNDEPASYSQPLQAELDYWLRGVAPALAQGPGQIHLLRGTTLEEVDRWQLLAAARAVVDASQGTLAEQLGRQVARPQYALPPVLPAGWAGLAQPRLASPWQPEAAAQNQGQRLQLFNGIGGVDARQREYVITLSAHATTPAPWVNVIANAGFGTVVSESGGGYTWSGNSRENPLTPWSNDPVIDTPGEVFYVFEPDSGELWTPTALPIRRDQDTYRIHHGRGYTRFEHHSHDIDAELLVLVAPDQPVKISRLRLHNRSNRPRTLIVTAYAEWSLGPARVRQAHFIRSSWDEGTGALLARNPWNADAAHRVAFFDLCGRQQSGSADRGEFLGRHGSLEFPAGAQAQELSGRSGPGLDPCAALQLHVTLAAGALTDVTALLGQCEGIEGARQLIGTARGWNVDQLLQQLRAQWSDRLDSIQIATPDAALNLLANDWLLYQVWSARYWGRAGFYQAGGAYGFRDQLQDGEALVLTAPAIAREHLLRAGARQFASGDVQHWWHPPGGRGVRTHISDDRLWLAHAIERYLRVTGDTAVLDQQLPFLEGPDIPAGREDLYFEPDASGHSVTLYEHAALALDASLALGPHGLPLIGAGDWNDGMNRVGPAGRGESVWLAWFLCATLDGFAPIAIARGETARAQRWLAHATQLRATIEAVAWDGAWYRRAIFDDGTVLGTATASECSIDAIAQSWSVLAGGDPARSRQAMESAATQLADAELHILKLLAPPFDAGSANPGYIKGYVPGVRENGAQYTHAAVWTAIAALRLGDIERGWRWLQWLNPLARSHNETEMRRYAVEPYVVAADIYAAAGHAGRGGWTWYTGAAGWLYRAIIEELIGLRIEADALRFAPKLPGAWPGVSLRYRRDGTLYRIAIRRAGAGHAVLQLTVDGEVQPLQHVPLRADGGECRVDVLIG